MSELVRYRNLIADSARWEGFAFRGDDVVVSASPKCGTTWTQMLCALLIFQDAHFDRPLYDVSPWLDQQTRKLDDVRAQLGAQRHRRFIKTHTPLDGLPFDYRVTYLCIGRDPRDVAMSMDHHWVNLDFDVVLRRRGEAVGNDDLDEILPHPAMRERPDDLRARFLRWVDDDTPPTRVGSSLAAVIHHVDTFWKERKRDNVALFHYSDLELDVVSEMRRLADVLEIEVSDALLAALAPAAAFAAMKDRAGELAPNADVGIFRDISSFFHRGESGQWRDVLGEVELVHYWERMHELAPPDLAHWLHHGRHG